MESSSGAGVYMSLEAAEGESKCVCSPGSLSLGHCSIRPNWVKRGRDGWRESDEEPEWDVASGCAKEGKKTGKIKREKDTTNKTLLNERKMITLICLHLPPLPLSGDCTSLLDPMTSRSFPLLPCRRVTNQSVAAQEPTLCMRGTEEGFHHSTLDLRCRLYKDVPVTAYNSRV